MSTYTWPRHAAKHVQRRESTLEEVLPYVSTITQEQVDGAELNGLYLLFPGCWVRAAHAAERIIVCPHRAQGRTQTEYHHYEQQDGPKLCDKGGSSRSGRRHFNLTGDRPPWNLPEEVVHEAAESVRQVCVGLFRRSTQQSSQQFQSQQDILYAEPTFALHQHLRRGRATRCGQSPHHLLPLLACCSRAKQRSSMTAALPSAP